MLAASIVIRRSLAPALALAVVEIGDVAIHDEEVYPQETFAERVSAMSSGQAMSTGQQ